MPCSIFGVQNNLLDIPGGWNSKGTIIVIVTIIDHPLYTTLQSTVFNRRLHGKMAASD